MFAEFICRSVVLKKMYIKFILFSQKRALLVFFIMTVVIAAQLLYLKNHLKIDTDLKALFKGTNPTVVQLQEMEEMIGTYSTVLVVAHSPDREKNIEALMRIKEKVENDPAVRFIEFDRNIEYIEKHALLFASVEDLEKIRNSVRNAIADKVAESLSFSEDNKTGSGGDGTSSLNEKLDDIGKKAQIYRDKYKINRFYEAENGTFVAMKVRPGGSETNISDTKTIVDLLDRAILETQPEKLGVTVEAGGHFRNKLKEMNAIYTDVFSTLMICIFLLCLTIVFYFRSIRALLIVFFPLSAGILSAITAMQFFTGGFNIISAFSFTILYGLGIDFNIHLLGRFSEERNKTGDCKSALENSSTGILPAIFSGAVTTVAAFFSLILIDFKGFSDFGLAAAIGVTTSFISILLFFPAVVFAFDRIRPLNIKAYKTEFLAWTFSKISKKPVVVTAVLAIITICSVISIRFAGLEYNFDNLTFPGKYDKSSITTQYIDAVKKNKADIISTGLPSFIVTNSAEETEDATRTLSEMMNHNDERSVALKDVLSTFTFLPPDQEKKLVIIKNIRQLIERKINLFDEKTVERYNSDFKPYLEINSEMDKNKLPGWITDKMSLKDGSFDRFIILAIGGNKSDVRDVITIRKEYGKIEGKIKDYKILGSYMLLSEIKTVIDKHIPLASLFAFLAVFAVLVIMYRSFKNALIVFLSLSAGILLMIFVAVIAGIKFNIFNMIVIPTVIGTGIDSAIHIFHRHHTSSEGSMVENLKNTGGAVFFSSLTTLVGFGSVAFAAHKGLQSIGIMASVGIITVTLVNLVFFPVIIVFIQERFQKK